MKFHRISTKDGLTQNTVRSILIDRKGFVWAGTLDGLNRYDGYRLISYRPQVGNINTLNDHRIKDVIQDRDGFLWIKTYKNEFSCYAPQKDTFMHYYQGRNTISANTFTETPSGSIWLWGQDNICLRIIKKKDRFVTTLFRTAPLNQLQDDSHFLTEDSKGTVWIGKSNGLYAVKENKITIYYRNKYDFTQAVENNDMVFFSTAQSRLVVFHHSNKTFQEIKLTIPPIKNILSVTNEGLLLICEKQLYFYNLITQQLEIRKWMKDTELKGPVSVVRDNKQGIWLYNHTGNIWSLDRTMQTAKKLRLIPAKTVQLIDLERYNVLQDKQGLFWITTYGSGLFCYDPKSGKLTNYRYKRGLDGLQSDYLLAIAEDRFGNIWIGNEYGGIIRVMRSSYQVTTIRPEAENSFGRNNNVRALSTHSNGEVWLGTKNGGLYVYNKDLTRSSMIRTGITPYALMEDKKKKMWVGTKGNGLFLFDADTHKELSHFSSNNKENYMKYNVVYSILEDSKNRIWVGYFPGGIACFDGSTANTNFHYLFENAGNRSYVRCLFQDNQGRIWAGTSDGILRFYPDELLKKPKAYVSFRMDLKDKTSLCSNDIKAIFQDLEGTIWIGTAGGGLNKYIPSTKDAPEHFVAYSTEQGLSGSIVSGIMEDSNQDLWISTENGMNRFNKKTQSFVNYFFSSETYGNHFNENVQCRMPNGNMLWGTLDGLLLFNPKTFTTTKNNPPVVFTNFLLNGQLMRVGDQASPLTESFSYAKSISLNYRQNTFTIEFSTLSLGNPESNSYSYKLENFDSQWSNSSSVNFATYKNLSPGKYVFKVKGFNSDGIWDGKYTQMIIVIQPPFWASVWAYFIYLILALIAIYFSLRLAYKFNKLNNDVEVEKQLTNHKLRFFTNISHEFRTPLTLIHSAVETINEQKNISPEVRRQIKVLNRNSVNLSRLIDQLLEFRKLENKVLTLNLSLTNMVKFCQDIFNSFKEISEQKGITYTYHSTEEALNIYIDRKKVDKILYNLLSNAFKFTRRGGVIDLYLKLEQPNNQVVITVKDNGIGIPKEKQPLLFSRFMQINFSSTGTGVGLSLAKEFVDAHKGKIGYDENPEGGSIFQFILPTDISLYSDVKFIEEDPSDEYTKEESLIHDTLNQVQEQTDILHGEEQKSISSDYRLLIVEDNDDIRTYLQEEFKEYFIVDLAENGKEGLEKAIGLNPDFIICDVMMPEMDGYEVTQQLKSNFETCHIPILLLTAHSSLEHQLEGFQKGADAYITKPFSLRMLKTRVFKLLEQREKLKKRFSNEYVLDGNLITYTDKDKQFYDLIERILEENYADSLFSVDKFAELAHVRRTIFYKKLKGITGVSPNDLIKMKRMKKAAELLLKGDFTVSEVSYKVGFEDPFYFSKCFKAQFNCSPSKYGDKPISE